MRFGLFCAPLANTANHGPETGQAIEASLSPDGKQAAHVRATAGNVDRSRLPNFRRPSNVTAQ